MTEFRAFAERLDDIGEWLAGWLGRLGLSNIQRLAWMDRPHGLSPFFTTSNARTHATEARLAAMEGMTEEPELSTSTSSSGSSLGSSAPPMLPARGAPGTAEGLAALAEEGPKLDGVQEALGTELAQSMARFQQRCVHVDPVTNKTLYGEGMKQKVGGCWRLGWMGGGRDTHGWTHIPHRIQQTI